MARESLAGIIDAADNLKGPLGCRTPAAQVGERGERDIDLVAGTLEDRGGFLVQEKRQQRHHYYLVELPCGVPAADDTGPLRLPCYGDVVDEVVGDVAA